LDPVEVDDDFFNLFKNPRIMPHLHISLQAADDMILTRMKRRHLRHHIIEFCDKARL
jgi:threonylcarbamoyladenosine tRNA methylthiotransferase MtaB